MANKKISDLTEILSGAVDPAADFLELADMSVGQSKKVLAGALVSGVVPDVNGDTVFLARFDASTPGTFVARDTAPEIGGNWRIHYSNSQSEQRMIVDTGGGLRGVRTAEGGSAIANTNWYLSGDPGENIRRIVFVLERKISDGATGLPNGFTFAFADTPVLGATSGGDNALVLPAYMWHITTTTGAVNDLTYSTVGGSVGGTSVPPTNPPTSAGAGIYPWFQVTAVPDMPFNKKFTIEFQFEGSQIRMYAFGKVWVWDDANFATHPARYWFIEDEGPSTPFKSYGLLHQVSVNSDKWGDQERLTGDTLGEFVAGAPVTRNKVQGGVLTTSTLALNATDISVTPASGAMVTISGGNGSTTQIRATQGNYLEMGNSNPLEGSNRPRVQIIGYEAGGTLQLNSGTTNSTSKSMAITCGHYNTAQLGMMAINATSSLSANVLNIGGESSTVWLGSNAATQISFWATSGTTTSGGTEQLRIISSGVSILNMDRTITAAGTTGARTINKLAGSVNFAAAASSVVVTNSLVTVDSIILVTLATNDATAVLGSVVAAAGSFTIRMTTAPAAESRVNFLVTN